MDNLLVLLVFLPVLFTALLPFVSPKKEVVHFYGIGMSALLFLTSLAVWSPDARGASDVLIPWLPELGISFALGLDGLSSTLVVLTTFLLLMAAIASISNIFHRVRLYYAMLFLITTSVLGVFLARDAFLFFLFYELELIPMYLLIAIWGGPNRQYAATKFALYTLFASVFMVAAILGIYLVAANMAQVDPTINADYLFHFETFRRVGPQLMIGFQVLVFMGFFIAFAVKLPVVPFHTWLPDAHVEAPTPVSMLLAGILLKMGAYGMFRFCWEFLPEAALQLAPWLALLAVINIVYTAGVALVQTDMKKLIAYSSVSHMGFVLLGLCAMNPAGFQGAIFVMFAHGIVSAALFMCVGTLYLRTHSRQIADYGGFGSQVPGIFYCFMFMSMASLGLPLLISFASETLVFYGAYTSNFFNLDLLQLSDTFTLGWNMQTVTILSGLGIVIGAAYLLWLLQRLFFGPLNETTGKGLNDLMPSEVVVLLTLALVVVAYGFRPQLLTRHFEPLATQAACMYMPASLISGHAVMPAGCENYPYPQQLRELYRQMADTVSLAVPPLRPH